VSKICAFLALACAGIAAAGPVAPAEAAGGGTQPAGAAGGQAVRAEAIARRAVAPLAVESVVCVNQSRRRTVCFLAHPDADGRTCRSTVVVRARRARVIQSYVCFEFRGVTP
jgi:hypothetical protein